MKADILKRLIDFVFYLSLIGMGIGGYFVYERIKAHDQLVSALVELIDAQRAALQVPAEEVVEEQ